MRTMVRFFALLALLTLTGCLVGFEDIGLPSETAAGPQMSLSSHVSGATIAGIEDVTGTCDTDSVWTLTGSFKGSPLEIQCVNGSFSLPLQLTGAEGLKALSAKGKWAAKPGVTEESLEFMNPTPALRGVNLFTQCGNYSAQYHQRPEDNVMQAWDLDYYKSRGQTLIRLTFGWEYTQPTLNGVLTPWVVTCIRRVLDMAEARSMKVILDLHNYGRYIVNNNGGEKPDGGSWSASDQSLLGSVDLPNTAYANLWTRVATEFNSHPALFGYGLMNEPHDMPTVNTWPDAAQAAVTAIRNVDTTTSIIVAGDGWSSAEYWATNNLNLAVNDPNDNVIYEAHVYFDPYGAGQYPGTYDSYSAYPDLGIDKVKPFVDWLKAGNRRGLIGEFGVPGNDPRWLVVKDRFMRYLSLNGVHSTAWAGGFMWELFGHLNAWFNIAPVGSPNSPPAPVDRPQMSILKKYPSSE